MTTRFMFTVHSLRQIESKGFSRQDIIAVAQRPDISYESHRHPGQMKCIGRGLCVVVDPARAQIITVFLHMVDTDLRPDQIAAGVTYERRSA